MTQDSLIYIVGTGVCGGLTSAVVYLFHLFEKSKSELVKHFTDQLNVVNARLKDCEDDRNKLRDQILVIHREMIELKQRLP